MMRESILAVALCLFTLNAQAGDLPNSSKTPGDINPILTRAKLCAKGFSTRPYRHVTPSARTDVYSSYGMSPKKKPCPCEVDHLISLEVGGSNSEKNLWPQSYTAKPWNAHVKDKLENRLHELVCTGKITLGQAQTAIRTNWIAAYKKYVGGSAK